MLHLFAVQPQTGYTPPSPFATPPLVPPALDPLPADWATAQRLDTINMDDFDPTECASIQPRVYHDEWCVRACLINFCLDDICTCGTDSEGRTAKERGEAIDKQNMDNWQESENREKSGDCTIVSCPQGLPSDVGKQANETSQANEEFQDGIDRWKEGEDRLKNADPNKAYPDGLPPVGQLGGEDTEGGVVKRNAGQPFTPDDPSTCRSLLPDSITDSWCQNTCQALCPPGQCECDGHPAKQAQQQEDAAVASPAPQQQEAAPVESPVPKSSAPKTASAPCVSLGPSSSDTNDRWCNLSCVNVNGNCPASMCECDEKKLKAAQDAMAVTPAAKVPERDAAIADRDAAIHEDRDPAKTDAPAANRDSRH